MAGRKVATYGGLAAVGAGAYYLYNAGGDPKLAEKKFERKLPYSVVSFMPGTDIDTQTMPRLQPGN